MKRAALLLPNLYNRAWAAKPGSVDVEGSVESVRFVGAEKHVHTSPAGATLQWFIAPEIRVGSELHARASVATGYTFHR